MFSFVPVSEAIEAFLPDLIAEAEKFCGKKGPRFQDLTVEFTSDERAPYTEIDPDTGLAKKILLRSAILDEDPEKGFGMAGSECAHEVVHCLAPCPLGVPHPCAGHSTSTVLEEGLATLFQAKIHDEVLGIRPPFMEKYKHEVYANYRHYAEAAELVKRLRVEKPGAVEKLRASLAEEAETCIGLISYTDIKREFKDLEDVLARDLAKPLSELKRNDS
jgi:hypothetical protein